MGEKRRRGALSAAGRAKVAGITMALNVVMAFIFQFGQVLGGTAILFDAAISAVITTILNVLLTYISIQKSRARGELPEDIPENAALVRLPKNPVLLTLVFSIVFALAFVALNAGLIWIFQIKTCAFVPFLLWKLAYSSVMSVTICELAILRFIQPDCARA